MAAVAHPATTPLSRTAAVAEWHARSNRRTWRATLSTAFLNPIFFLLSVGVLLGQLIDDDRARLGGLTYIEFVAPGLLAAMAMQLASNDGMWPIMAGIRWLRTYHAVLATPVGVVELVVGTMAWTAVRVLTAATIFTGVAAVGGAVNSPLAVLAPLAALLTGLAFNAPITAFAASLESAEDGWFPALNRFVLVPMFLFAGTFFPVSQLPDWLEPVAWATPLWHGVELCRMLTSGELSALALVHVAYLAALIVVGAVVAVRFHRKALLT